VLARDVDNLFPRTGSVATNLLHRTFFHVSRLRRGRRRCESHSTIHLRAIHAQRAVVVEHQSIRTERVARCERLNVKQLLWLGV
jgi:hypothetical protein